MKNQISISKSQSVQELTKFKRFVLPVFTEKERAESQLLITEGKLKAKSERILNYGKEYWGFDPLYYTYDGLKYLAKDMFDTYSGLSCSPEGLFRFRGIGKEWIKHFVIAFSLEEKWMEYYNKYSRKYLNLPKEKQIFPIEEAPDFQI